MHNFQIEEQDEAAPKDISHIRGLLTITLAGIIIAFICALVEFHKNVKRLSTKHKIPYGKMFGTELKRSFSGHAKRTEYIKKPKRGEESVELL